MNLFKNVHESWIPLLHSLAYKEPLMTFIAGLSQMSVQPEMSKIFRVFEMSVGDIKVVILGQDPYPIPQTANGLAYGVKDGAKIPKISDFIREEVVSTVPWSVQRSGEGATLEKWENQGVFLLNTALTVETGSAGSHVAHWREFTETIVSYISEINPCVWLLWGRNAHSYKIKIKNSLAIGGYDRETIEEIPVDNEINYVVLGMSPMVRVMEEVTTFSNDSFHMANKILEKKSLKQIIW